MSNKQSTRTHSRTPAQTMFPALSGSSSTPSQLPSAATQQSENFLRADAAQKRHQAYLARKEQERLEFLSREAKRAAKKKNERADLIQAQFKKNPSVHIRCILLWYMMLPGGKDLRTENDLEEDRAFHEAEWAKQQQREEDAIEEDRMTEKYLKKCEEERALAESEGRLDEYDQDQWDLYDSEAMQDYFSCQSNRDMIKKDAIRCPFCHECNYTPHYYLHREYITK